MKFIDVPQSGHQGTFISFKTRHGQSRRQYVIPKNPRTPAQVRVRSWFGRGSAFWRTLTDMQRAAWIATGAQEPCEGRLGKSGTMSGIQICVSINGNLAFVGEPPVAEPPIKPVFGANPVGNLIATNAGGVVALKLSVPTAPIRYTLVFGTKPCSVGVSFPGRFVFLGLLPEPVGGVSEITELYVARYGVPPADKRVFIQTMQQINGWRDYPKQTTAVVPRA